MPINHLNGDQIVLKSTTPAVSGPMAVVGALKKSAVNLYIKKKKKRFYPIQKAKLHLEAFGPKLSSH